MNVIIKIQDPVHSKCIKGKDIVWSCLSYNSVAWRRDKYGTRKTNIIRSLLTKRNSHLLTGLIPRVSDYCASRNISIKIIDEIPKIVPLNKPRINTIVLRKDQKKLIDKAISKQRGIIISPTGSGKTIIILAIMSCFPTKNILFLCHTTSLLTQTENELDKFGFKNVNVIGGGHKDDFSHITIATIQSFSKFNPSKYCDYFDIVIVDEAHHVNNRKSQYGKVLQYSAASMKLGFTATIPREREKILNMEGLIGPPIGELTLKEGIKTKILAVPKIILIPVPINNQINDIKGFANIYREAIVHNKARNRLIVKESKLRLENDKSVLCMVKDINHGHNLIITSKAMKTPAIFIRGSTPIEERELIKIELNKKKKRLVICTAIWKEGINIPTLDSIILAFGGKSELSTLQALGRGLRATKNKNKVEIIDFLDPYNYVARHAIERISTYVKNGWL